MSPQSKKKKCVEPALDEVPDSEQDDDDNDVVVEEQEDENEQEEVEDQQEDEAEEEEPSGRVLSEEQLAERSANARKRRRAVARRKGYRILATKGGYSNSVPSGDASRDVAQNVLSVKEATRACKWAPAIPEKAAYATFEEYAERLKMQTEPLPQGPAAVFRASGEIFLRKIFNESVQRTFEAGKTRVSTNTVMSVLRPLQPVLKFSFSAPTGLVRHAQMTAVGPEGKKTTALGTLEMDEAQISKEQKSTLPKQIELHKSICKAAADAKRKLKEKQAQQAQPAETKKKVVN